jgi:hypothetical protein
MVVAGPPSLAAYHQIAEQGNAVMAYIPLSPFVDVSSVSSVMCDPIGPYVTVMLETKTKAAQAAIFADSKAFLESPTAAELQSLGLEAAGNKSSWLAFLSTGRMTSEANKLFHLPAQPYRVALPCSVLETDLVGIRMIRLPHGWMWVRMGRLRTQAPASMNLDLEDVDYSVLGSLFRFDDASVSSPGAGSAAPASVSLSTPSSSSASMAFSASSSSTSSHSTWMVAVVMVEVVTVVMVEVVTVFVVANLCAFVDV